MKDAPAAYDDDDEVHLSIKYSCIYLLLEITQFDNVNPGLHFMG